MRIPVLGLIGLGLVAACSGSSGAAAPADDGGGTDTGTGSPGRDGGGAPPDSTGGADAPARTDGGDGGAFPDAGNPDGACTTLTLPSETQLADTSLPTSVVGNGTPT